MPNLAIYDQTTGAILGVWSAATTALLEANVRDDDPTKGYLFFEEPDPVTAQDLYRVQDSELVLKTP